MTSKADEVRVNETTAGQSMLLKTHAHSLLWASKPETQERGQLENQQKYT